MAVIMIDNPHKRLYTVYILLYSNIFCIDSLENHVTRYPIRQPKWGWLMMHIYWGARRRRKYSLPLATFIEVNSFS